MDKHFYKESIVSAIKDAIVNDNFNKDYHIDDYTLNISGGDYESTITLSSNSRDLIKVFYISKDTNRWDWLFKKGEVIQKIADRIYEECNN